MCEAAVQHKWYNSAGVTVLAHFGSPHRSTLQPGACLISVRGTSASGSSACKQKVQVIPTRLEHRATEAESPPGDIVQGKPTPSS